MGEEASSLGRQAPEPVGRRHAAIHQEVAAGNERAVRPHQQRRDISDFIRACQPVSPGSPRSCAGSPRRAAL